MIELIERTLLNGGNLEEARETLLNQANINRNNQWTQIEHDYKIARLIRECLLIEPKGSAGFSVSKGIISRLREKYRDPENEKIIKKLRKEAKEIDSENEAKQGRTGTENTI